MQAFTDNVYMYSLLQLRDNISNKVFTYTAATVSSRCHVNPHILNKPFSNMHLMNSFRSVADCTFCEFVGSSATSTQLRKVLSLQSLLYIVSCTTFKLQTLAAVHLIYNGNWVMHWRVSEGGKLQASTHQRATAALFSQWWRSCWLWKYWCAPPFGIRHLT